MRALSGGSGPAASLNGVLQDAAAAIRTTALEILTSIGLEHRGHPGATLSIVEIVACLYFEVMRVDPARPDWPDRDRFILSKGHGCLAVLETCGACADGTTRGRTAAAST